MKFPTTYKEALELLGSRATRKLANNTYLERQERMESKTIDYIVRLHSTAIVTFRPDGTRILSTGGWQTATTRERMHRCGVSICLAGGVASVTHGKRELAYLDGMELLPRGRAEGHGGPAEKVRKLRARTLRKDPEAWRWPGRQGGETDYGFKGNCPEASLDPEERIMLERRLRTMRDAARHPFARRLKKLGACYAGIAFALKFRTLEEAWAACTNGNWKDWLVRACGGDPMQGPKQCPTLPEEQARTV